MEFSVDLRPTVDAWSRTDRRSTEKIIFYSGEAIQAAVREGRLPAEIGSRLLSLQAERYEPMIAIEWCGLESFRAAAAAGEVLRLVINCYVPPYSGGIH